MVAECSAEVLVNFTYQSSTQDGFLTKQNIIKEQLKKTTLICPNDDIVYPFGLTNSNFEIYKKNNLISIALRNNSIAELDLEVQSSIVKLYSDLIGNNSLPQLLRDIIYLISLLVFYFYMFFSHKTRLLFYLKKMKKKADADADKSFKDFNENNSAIKKRVEGQMNSFLPMGLIPIHESTFNIIREGQISSLSNKSKLSTSNFNKNRRLNNIRASTSNSNLSINRPNNTRFPKQSLSATNLNAKFICPDCGLEAKTNAGLSSHIRSCKSKSYIG